MSAPDVPIEKTYAPEYREKRRTRIVWPDVDHFEKSVNLFKVLMLIASLLGGSAVAWMVWVSKAVTRISVPQTCHQTVIKEDSK